MILQLLNVQVPALFKSIIDSLNIEMTADSTAWILAGSVIIGCMYLTITCVHLEILIRYFKSIFADGAARIGATLFTELLNAVFANVGQRAVRKVARETFEHLLSLDLKFHLSRQTGGLTRAIDRGTK